MDENTPLNIFDFRNLIATLGDQYDPTDFDFFNNWVKSVSPIIVTHMPDPIYRGIKAVSQSALKEFASSPAHYRYKKNKQTKAKAEGTLLDLLIFEPEELHNVFEYAGYESKTSAGWRNFKKNAEGSGKIPIIKPELDSAEEVANAIKAKPRAKWILDNSLTQPCVYWREDYYGVDCKGKLDALLIDPGLKYLVIADLKYMADASKYGFGKSIEDYGYHKQMAWYMRGITQVVPAQQLNCCWIVAEKGEFTQYGPEFVALHDIDPKDMAEGEKWRIRTLEKLSHCLSTDQWPGYGERFEMVSRPSWAQARDEYRT